MMEMINLIKLSEPEKRVIILLLIGFIFVFVLVGYISLIVKKVMDSQASKADEMLKNVVDAEYFNSEKKLVHFGIRKNIRVFFKEARVPFIILAISWFALLLYCLFSGNWHPNLFDNESTGIRTLFFVFDWSDKSQYTAKIFFLTLISDFPPIITRPHFVWSAWFSYLFIPANAVGIIWFLITTQAYIARSFRIRKIAKGIFRKKLVPEENPPQQTNINQQ